jgi:hypothetical protein
LQVSVARADCEANSTATHYLHFCCGVDIIQAIGSKRWEMI